MSWHADPTQFQASIDSLNAYLSPSVLRKYQADILDSGRFDLTSPLTGIRVSVTRSVLFSENIAYFVPDGAGAWLIAGFIERGFPLYEVILQADGTRHRVAPIFKWKHKELADTDAEWLLANGARLTTFAAPEPVALIIGHTHFAHHAWNELPALDKWLQMASTNRLSKLLIISTSQPMGPLRDLFQVLSDTRIVTMDPATLQRWSDATISVRLGSRLVTESIREKVRNFCQHNANGFSSHRSRSALSTAWPRIWVSVRLESRTPDNMEEFLLTAFAKISQTYPESMFLLNGYSFPYGFDSNKDQHRKNAKARAQARSADEYINSLRQAALRRFGSDLATKIHNISSLSLTDAIRFGEFVDYYICHAGALQHMVAWFHDVPGFVHSPRMEGKDSSYNFDAVEAGIIPDIVPSNLVARSDLATRREGRRNANYTFLDVEETATLVVSLMRKRLGAIRQNRNGGADVPP
ncbi:MAG TPA: hypothetical protein VHX61_05605 [Rhizomicrobium sp.]|jgi:hypothetical protein|nr:hypothetical protein [Rhizomicrobium sp.]